MLDFRSLVVQWADWCVAHRPWFDYEESRPFPLYLPSATRRIANDCSATSVLVLWLAHAPEPFPGAYAGEGNTESFLTLQHVSAPLPADFVVYGEGLPLGDQHMATVVEAGPDPLTMSHGWSGEPAFVRVSAGCPPQAEGRVTYVRCLPVVVPPPPPAPPLPKENDMGVLAISSGSIKGDWLVRGHNRCNVSPNQVAALLACNVARVTLSDAELSVFTPVAWTEV